MPYVMLPVPEEHVEEVMQFILRAISKASMRDWDADSVSKVYGETDEASRSLLAFVARAAVEGNELETADAARRIQLSAREVVGILNELNSLAREDNLPSILGQRVVPDRLPNGRIAEKRVLQMDLEVAELVRAAEQAEIAAARDPLGQTGQ